MCKSIPTVFILAFCSVIAAQQAMDNASVLKLVKAGLADDLIVNTINASPGKYDTSADALFALKSAGADSKVISAVLLKSRPGPPPSRKRGSGIPPAAHAHTRVVPG